MFSLHFKNQKLKHQPDNNGSNVVMTNNATFDSTDGSSGTVVRARA